MLKSPSEFSEDEKGNLFDLSGPKHFYTDQDFTNQNNNNKYYYSFKPRTLSSNTEGTVLEPMTATVTKSEDYVSENSQL